MTIMEALRSAVENIADWVESKFVTKNVAGTLDDLNTNDKTSLVAAINEVFNNSTDNDIFLDKLPEAVESVLEQAKASGEFDGKSAYELAVENGFNGTEEEWLASLVGKNGSDGNGIKSVVLNEDYTLTLNFDNGTSYTTPSICGESGEHNDSVLYIEQLLTEEQKLQARNNIGINETIVDTLVALDIISTFVDDDGGNLAESDGTILVTRNDDIFLPEVTDKNNGDILRVVDGKWTVDTINLGSEGGNSNPVSWNDLSDRPFYDTTTYEQETVLPKTEIEAVYNYPEAEAAKVAAALCPVDNLIADERYRVVFDGAEYITTCQRYQTYDETVLWLGDFVTYSLRFLGYQEGDENYNDAVKQLESAGMFVTGEPFCLNLIYYDGGTDHAFVTDDAGVHTLEIMHITGETGEIKTLDEKFIPDSIARVSDIPQGGQDLSVQPDLTQNDETAPDYVKGRTHWDEMVEIDWLGDTEDRDSLVYDGTTFVKISDNAPKRDLMEGAVFDLYGEDINVLHNRYNLTANQMYYLGSGENYRFMGLFLVIGNHKNVYKGSTKIEVPSNGIYANTLWGRMTLTYGPIARPLDDKYIPDTIPRKDDIYGYLNWNNIYNKPFDSDYSSAVILSWDETKSNSDGELTFDGVSNADSYYHIANYTPTYNELLHEECAVTINGRTTQVTRENMTKGSGWIKILDCIYIMQNEGRYPLSDSAFVYAPAKGIYGLVKEGTSIDEFYLPFVDIITLDDKFISEEIARYEDVENIIPSLTKDWCRSEREHPEFVDGRTHYTEYKFFDYLDVTGDIPVIFKKSCATSTFRDHTNDVLYCFKLVSNGKKVFDCALTQDDLTIISGTLHYFGNGSLLDQSYEDTGEGWCVYPSGSPGSAYVNIILTRAYEKGRMQFYRKYPTNNVKQLDEKYIPDTIARLEDLPQLCPVENNGEVISWDGDTTGKDRVTVNGYYYYKISDSLLEREKLIGGYMNIGSTSQIELDEFNIYPVDENAFRIGYDSDYCFCTHSTSFVMNGKTQTVPTPGVYATSYVTPLEIGYSDVSFGKIYEEFIPDTIAHTNKTLPMPVSAKVGQFVMVSAVNEDGIVTATEAVTLEDLSEVVF